MQMQSQQQPTQAHALLLPDKRSASKTRLITMAWHGLRAIARLMIAYMAYRAVLRTNQFLLNSPHQLLNDIGLTHEDVLHAQNTVRFSDFRTAKL